MKRLLLVASLLLAGCATPSAPKTLFDLGPLPAAGRVASTLPALSVATAKSSPFLDNPRMVYRLAYANSQQPQQFANSRWTMTPAQLIEQRLKARLGQADSTVLTDSDGALNVPLLRLELDDFAQIFATPTESTGQVTVRVAVYRGRLLVAQKSFTQQRPATSADAAGGAQALAAASDGLITDVLGWLATLPLKKE
ncbi:ABC-type transport auxiliary lipoprotein family protein [Actimicrobium sp. CCI2.3]|uniref:ABC-type transport auxiliary lipoprotein family protein n=1 Tax=Actimicrobium sp. CCI2.3 TaxID=3048616 RepID=UPI002AB47735|nr:ABC-type transport auxiliary lipoprotein family protein [Actimicrobium sp. CCI2.3]MDY7576627.1 ABC-type transport auxiliary lipoprotein family protein [Actimicrobium sp. CCI2.3]MEB0021228.1 ABC-type transport auxiliary lipoprotein family protein [Actimicrobium sp. CCI2.3]